MIDLIQQVKWLVQNPGASTNKIDKAQQILEAAFKPDYREFLKLLDGGSGLTSDERNICFFGTDELPEVNAAASTDDFLPNWMIFASDLSGKSYLMRRRGDGDIGSCFDDAFADGELHIEANSFSHFVCRIANLSNFVE